MKLIRVATPDGPQDAVLDVDLVRRREGTAAAPDAGAVIGPLEDLRLLVPCTPSKVIGAGRNYASNLAAKGRPTPTEPFLFLKAPNAVVGHDEPIIRPPGAQTLEYEAELCVVIGTRARHLTAENWRDHVLGYTCGNDVAVRDWQAMDRQWVFAKSADTLCPLGPWIETDPGDPDDLPVRARVNGTLTQDGRTSDTVFDTGALLVAITASITLEPGDVVMTGTPDGAGPVADGDVVEVEVGGIGTLRNQVVGG